MPIRNLSRLRRIACSPLLFAAIIPYGILTFSGVSHAQQAPAPVPPSVSYARMADLVSASSAIATVKIRSVVALKPDRAPDLQPGRARFYVEAETQGLIRGDGVAARRISFLVDGSAANARKPGLKGQIFLLFGRVGGQVNQFQLTSSTAMIPWSPANEALTRSVLTQVMAQDVPPVITGVTSAFHVAGAILGEGETQIFLQTANGTPISLSIIRRPDEETIFSASLGEIVDDSAAFPKKDTMLWYRLACGLPGSIPAPALADLDRNALTQAREDYEAFRQALGHCDRTATPIL